MSAPTDFVRLLKGLENDPISRLVLFCISFYTNFKTGECWPSISTLAEESNLHPTTVRRHVHELEKRGFIKLQRRERASSIITLVGYKPPLRDGDTRTFTETNDTSTPLVGTSTERVGTSTQPVDAYSHSARGVLAQNSHPTSAALGEIYNLNIINNSFIKNDLDSSTTDEVKERVYLHNDKIKLCDELNQDWLGRFDGQEDLDLALLQIRPYLQLNSPTRSIEAQVSSQLSRIVREKKDRDRRYQAAAQNKSSNNKSTVSTSSRKASYDENAAEFWAKVDRGEIKI